MEYRDRVVIVTGAGRGIGRATATMFAKEGAAVVACDVSEAGLGETLSAVRETLPGTMTAEAVDVRDEKAVGEAVKRAAGKYGRIDVLVNCAGVIHLGKVEDITAEQWDMVLGINLKGTFIFSKAVVPVMKSQRRGCIVNVTAAAAKTGGMNVGGDYVSSKGGISSLTIHLAKQLAPFGIRVNAVSPGPIDTPMLSGSRGRGEYSEDMRKNIVNATPLGLGTPEDIAHGILFLASETRARYITGEILDIDGGLFMD